MIDVTCDCAAHSDGAANCIFHCVAHQIVQDLTEADETDHEREVMRSSGCDGLTLVQCYSR
jgi:hypothetical protein